MSSYCLRTPPNLWPQTAPAVEPLQRLNLKDIWCVRSGFRSHARRKHCLPGHPFCRLGHTGLLVSRSGTYVQSLKLMQSRGFRRVNSHFGWLGLGVAPRFLQKVRARPEILTNKLGLLPRREAAPAERRASRSNLLGNRRFLARQKP